MVVSTSGSPDTSALFGGLITRVLYTNHMSYDSDYIGYSGNEAAEYAADYYSTPQGIADLQENAREEAELEYLRQQDQALEKHRNEVSSMPVVTSVPTAIHHYRVLTWLVDSWPTIIMTDTLDEAIKEASDYRNVQDEIDEIDDCNPDDLIESWESIIVAVDKDNNYYKLQVIETEVPPEAIAFKR